MALFVAGQKLTAAALEALKMSAVKTADTTKTSTASFADDPHLTIASVPISTRYAVHVLGTYNAAATPDLKINFTSPAGTTGSFGGMDGGTGFTGVSLGTDFNFTGSGGVTLRLEIFGWILTSTTAGAFTLRLAQVTSNASASTLHNGTSMRLYPI